MSRKTLMIVFIGYNMVLAGLIIGPLTAQLFPTQRTVTFSNSDFTLSILSSTAVEMSKPFPANLGEALTLNLEVWAINNASGHPVRWVFSPSRDYGPCTGCGVTVAELGTNGQPLSPPGPAPTPETISGYTYNVTKTSTYVVLFYFRTFLVTASCISCTANISGTVTIAPKNSPSYSYLPIPLVVSGLFVMAVPSFRPIWNRVVIKK